jgi:transcriptional regulator with XRE-family HTH domain
MPHLLTSLDQLAAESGVSRRTVNNTESGRHAIRIDNLIDMARALGVTAAQ